MKILVFGATGQVAQSLIELKSEQFDVHAFGRPEGDITDMPVLRTIAARVQPDLIVNAAAYTAVDAAETDEEGAFLVNETGSKNLAELAVELDVPLIHYSTDYVFNGEKSAPYKNDDPVAPLGVYGRSKEAGEQAIRTICEKHVIIRTAWVFSPFGKNFVKTMLALGKDRDELRVVEDQTGNPTYAPDIARATQVIAENLVQDQRADMFGTFHFSNEGDTNWYEFASEIFAQAKSAFGIECIVHPIPSSEFPTPAKRPTNSRLDCSAIEKSHGIVRRSWKSALADCLNELKADA